MNDWTEEDKEEERCPLASGSFMLGGLRCPWASAQQNQSDTPAHLTLGSPEIHREHTLGHAHKVTNCLTHGTHTCHNSWGSSCQYAPVTGFVCVCICVCVLMDAPPYFIFSSMQDSQAVWGSGRWHELRQRITCCLRVPDKEKQHFFILGAGQRSDIRINMMHQLHTILNQHNHVVYSLLVAVFSYHS